MLFVHSCSLLLDLVVVDILIVRHELVDGTLGRELDDTVGNRLDELGIVGGEQNVALESHEVVVQA